MVKIAINTQFVYGIGLAVLGTCVLFVGTSAISMARIWVQYDNPDSSYERWAVPERGIVAFATFLLVLGLGMALVPPIVKFMTADRALAPTEPPMEPEDDQSEAV